MNLQSIVVRVSAAAGACVLAPHAHAGVAVGVEQVGADVVVSGSGVLDLSSWTYLNTVGQPPGIHPGMAIQIGTGAQSTDLYYQPSGFTGPSSIGPGLGVGFADSGVGAPLGLFWGLPSPAISVPLGYASGDPILGASAVFGGQTLVSLGLAEGSYTWSWATSDGQGDFFTINVLPAPGGVCTIGMIAVFGLRRRRVRER